MQINPIFMASFAKKKMKQFYILFSVLISALAGAQNYNFINSTATYNNLTGATSLNKWRNLG